MTPAKASGGRCPDCGGPLTAAVGVTSGFLWCQSCGEFIGPHKAVHVEAEKEPRPTGAAVLVRLADVEPEDVTWLWADRIPRGKLTVVMGDPGIGKSWITLAISTAVTTASSLPEDDTLREPEDVLLLSAEDGLADTIRPRLDEMGADIRRVTALKAFTDPKGREEWPSLRDHLDRFDDILAAGKFALVVIDPLNAYLAGLDAFRDNEVRSVLGPFAQLAEKHNVAVVAVCHLTKGKRDQALYRLQGSIGYGGQARSVLLVGQDGDSGKRAIIPIKNNLTEEASAIGFDIKDGSFHWTGRSSLTKADLLAPDAEQGEGGAAREAEAFLHDALADSSRIGKEVQREAASLGISNATLRRARERLGVQWRRIGEAGKRGGGRILWSLPQEEDLLAQSNSVSKLIEFVPDAAQSGPVDEQVNPDEACSVCGEERDGDGGLTPSGEPRCFKHFVKETDGAMVRQAVEKLGLGIIAGDEADQL